MFPLTSVETRFLGEPYGNVRFPSILARMRWAGKPVSILVTHPLPPVAGFGVRNSQLAAMGQQRPDWDENLIITGDLNTSQWSPYFQKLLKQAHLRDSQKGFGVQPSWRVHDPRIAIPIDHVLVSPNFRVINRQIGPDIGSDHRPVIVDLTLR